MTWELPSPAVRRRHPDAVNAGLARFRSAVLPSRTCVVELLVEDSRSGERTTLATRHVVAPGRPGSRRIEAVRDRIERLLDEEDRDDAMHGRLRRALRRVPPEARGIEWDEARVLVDALFLKNAKPTYRRLRALRDARLAAGQEAEFAAFWTELGRATRPRVLYPQGYAIPLSARDEGEVWRETARLADLLDRPGPSCLRQLRDPARAGARGWTHRPRQRRRPDRAAGGFVVRGGGPQLARLQGHRRGGRAAQARLRGRPAGAQQAGRCRRAERGRVPGVDPRRPAVRVAEHVRGARRGGPAAVGGARDLRQRRAGASATRGTPQRRCTAPAGPARTRRTGSTGRPRSSGSRRSSTSYAGPSTRVRDDAAIRSRRPCGSGPRRRRARPWRRRPPRGRSRRTPRCGRRSRRPARRGRWCGPTVGWPPAW